MSSTKFYFFCFFSILGIIGFILTFVFILAYLSVPDDFPAPFAPFFKYTDVPDGYFQITSNRYRWMSQNVKPYIQMFSLAAIFALIPQSGYRNDEAYGCSVPFDVEKIKNNILYKIVMIIGYYTIINLLISSIVCYIKYYPKLL